MRILSLVHGPLVRSELFGDVARAEGHEVDEWSIADEPAPPRPVEEYDAVFVFGGHMNVDQESGAPVAARGRRAGSRARRAQGAAARGLPGRTAIGEGGRCARRSVAGAEAGFVRAELTEQAAGDPIFRSLPREFDVFVVHEYAFHVPDGGVELARSSVCSQAFRLGECAWALQFHPEVRLEQVEAWLRDDRLPNSDEIVAELRDRLDEWQAFGARLCRAFRFR